MGRFLAFLLVFVLGGLAGIFLGGVFGLATGTYVGGCAIVDRAVETGALSQEEANGLMRNIAADMNIEPKDKQRIVDAMKNTNPGSACATAINSL